MKLLTFAHQSEAQCFIRGLTKETLPKMHFYRSKNCIIQIVGQGYFYSALKVSYMLGLLGDDIDEVINLGVAGSLNKSCELGRIYPISEVSKLNQNALSISKNEGFKNLTSVKPLRTEEDRSIHSEFDIVDMELWGIASATKSAGKKISSYKLISDIVGENIFCEDIKKQAEVFSENLYNFYVSKFKL